MHVKRQRSFLLHAFDYFTGPVGYDTCLRKILNMLDEQAITVETRLSIV